MDQDSTCFSVWTSYNYIICSLLCVTGFSYVCLGAFLTGVSSSKLFVATNVTALGLGVILLGVILFVLSTFGCIATRRECYRCLLVYSILLIFVIITESVVAYLALSFRHDYLKTSEKNLKKLIKSYHWYSSEKERKVVDKIQQMRFCCGVYGPHDWDDHPPMPQSCCPKNYPFKCSLRSQEVYWSGCLKPVTAVFVICLNLIGHLSIICAVLEIPIPFFAMQLALTLMNRSSREHTETTREKAGRLTAESEDSPTN